MVRSTFVCRILHTSGHFSHLEPHRAESVLSQGLGPRIQLLLLPLFTVVRGKAKFSEAAMQRPA
jgi:hypothetical protein